MEKLQQKVIEKLRKHFAQHVEDGLETIPKSGRVTGWVAAEAFEELDHRERQKLLWDVLDRELTQEEQSNVGPIATLTPEEAKFDVSMDL